MCHGKKKKKKKEFPITAFFSQCEHVDVEMFKNK